MERTITRHDLASAINYILISNAVPNPKEAVQVLGSSGNGTRLFAVIPSERAKGALEGVLMRVTGRRHPAPGDVWVLDEAQGRALVRIVED